MSPLNNIPRDEWPTTAQLAKIAASVWTHVAFTKDAIYKAIEIWVAAYWATHPKEDHEEETPA